MYRIPALEGVNHCAEMEEKQVKPYKMNMQFPTMILRYHAVSSCIEVNHNLRTYCDIFMGPQYVDYLVHLDTDELTNVYRWRLEQERVLCRDTLPGMIDEKVISFVECHMPAYELYLDAS